MNRRKTNRRNRRGTVLVLSAAMMIMMMVFLGFAVDFGYQLNAHSELQRSADSAAIAGAWAMIDRDSVQYNSTSDAAIANARTNAINYAGLNSVCRTAPTVDPNTSNAVSGDVVVGYIPSSSPSTEMTFPGQSSYNAVQVKVQRTAAQNGMVPTFFAKVIGVNGLEADASATAMIRREIGGFRAPADGGNLGILPFALDEDTWNNLLAGNADDDWTWDETTQTISAGSDDVLEINLYPQGTGSPGNRGTVDIGSSNNSTADISRQILDGASPEDLEQIGGKIELDENGELFLNGDTGISAGVKDELTSIKGEPRVIPIFREVNGPGNNATYKIVKFAGVRIMEVNLTGVMSGKRVIIQPATIVIDGTIPTNEIDTSYFIYTHPVLVR